MPTLRPSPPLIVAAVCAALVCGTAGAAALKVGHDSAGHDLTGPDLAGEYDLRLAGLPIGSAMLTIAKHGSDYSVMGSARVGGVLSLISDSRGTAKAQGRLAGPFPAPASYALNSVSSDKDQTVRMGFRSSAITSLAVEPPVPPRPDRIPVTDADKRGVLDPLSALLVPGTEANAAACHRTLPVFDGAVRFDVPLTYARMEPVALDNGFSGEAVVCSARYRPLAGHRPNRSQTKFMTANTDLEYWLVAVPGAPVLAPWRIVVGTQIGRLTVTARRLTLGSAADLDASDAPN